MGQDDQAAPASSEQSTTTPPVATKGPRLVDVAVNDENTALNIMLGFLTIAQQKGAYSLEESAKIWECIKIFQKPSN